MLFHRIEGIMNVPLLRISMQSKFDSDTVAPEDEFKLTDDDVQLGLPSGTVLEIEEVVQYPDGVHMDFSFELPSGDGVLDDYNEDSPDDIYAFALENLVESGKLVRP